MIDEDIARAWIEMQHAATASAAYEALFWSYIALEDLRDSDIERYWSIINDIRRIDDSDHILANLAAGPVEDLLVYSSHRFIDRIESTAKVDERFRFMLGMVWKNKIPDDTWERIQRAASGK